MKKLSTLYKKDPKNLGLVINEVNPDNVWVFENGIPTRKFDGTASAIIDGELYKRFDLKKGRTLPEYAHTSAIPCQEADQKTGHQPHWVKCEREDKSNKWHFLAFDNMAEKIDGTYELCGEKVQGNPENIKGHQLILHGQDELDLLDFTFEGLKNYLTETDIEGIVFINKANNKMCKIRKSDFGIKR